MQLQSNPQLQRPYQEGNVGNNEILGSNGVHIHSMTDAPNIKDVWEDNFEQEFKAIMHLAEKYKVISMDTEFPGIVYRLNENDLRSISNYHEIEYRTIKMNVDKLKVIQVGLSFADENGFTPPGVGTWQFNFRFDLNSELYLKESIEMLSEAGIRFDKHQTQGIDPELFSEYLIASGLVLNDDIKWITFHGGFDFAYLLRMVSGQDLPEEDIGFCNLLDIYFPSFYDIKYMTKDIESLKNSSLSKIAGDLRVKRIGPQHQAGSDALLTLSTYFKLMSTYLKGVPELKHSNVLYGIGPHGTEGLSDYVLQNFIVSEYPYTGMMYNNYGMNTMNSMNPMMNSNYYPQADNMYSNPNTNQYNMPYGVYENYSSNPYMDAPNQKPKKFNNKMGMKS